jgi:hypothetical protein
MCALTSKQQENITTYCEATSQLKMKYSFHLIILVSSTVYFLLSKSRPQSNVERKSLELFRA